MEILIEIPHIGRFVFTDPEVVYSDLFGPCFTGPYKMQGGDYKPMTGTVPIGKATLIEPVPKQLEFS